jgi:transposase, IS5 family
MMAGQKGFWDIENRLAELSAEGDPLEKLSATVNFEVFRAILLRALRQAGGSRLGRPPFCPVLKFRMLVLQSLHGLSLERTAYMVRDRLSWMRFCGLGPGDRVPDANTLWDFRETLIKAKALDKLFARLNAAITKAGYLPMGGQIIDASLIAAPKQRNNDEEREAIKAGKSAEEIWPDEPNKARQKDVNARWTVKQGKAPAPGPDGKTPPAISIPVFGYKDHIGIDRRFGFIRTQKVTDAAAHDGARLREGLIDPENTASDVWADTAYRSAKNEDYLEGLNKKSRIHHKKPKGRPMSRAIARANAKKSKVRCHVEHVFAELKSRMGLVVRTIGIARAEAVIILANMAFNMKRWVSLNTRTLPA